MKHPYQSLQITVLAIGNRDLISTSYGSIGENNNPNQIEWDENNVKK